MTTITVDLTRLHDPRVATHVEGIDTRARGGFRLALDILGIPQPEYAKAKPAGRPSIAKLMERADKDSGTHKTYRDEKLGINAFAPVRN